MLVATRSQSQAKYTYNEKNTLPSETYLLLYTVKLSCQNVAIPQYNTCVVCDTQPHTPTHSRSTLTIET